MCVCVCVPFSLLFLKTPVKRMLWEIRLLFYCTFYLLFEFKFIFRYVLQYNDDRQRKYALCIMTIIERCGCSTFIGWLLLIYSQHTNDTLSFCDSKTAQIFQLIEFIVFISIFMREGAADVVDVLDAIQQTGVSIGNALHCVDCFQRKPERYFIDWQRLERC